MKNMRVMQRLSAALLAAAMGLGLLTGCSSETKTDSAANSADSTVSVTDAAGSEAETQPEAETEPPTTAHVSPTETVTSALGTQIDVDVTLNRDNDNTYQTKLSQFAQYGDVIDSFTFVFYAGDGVSNIGTYTGGCGISVTSDCTAATDPGWYQSDDFSTAAKGSYVEVTWQVPAEIRDSIDLNGEVLVGYWWGNTTTVKLSEVICNYTRTMTLPVDGTETISVGQTLNYNSEETKSVRVSLADALAGGRVPQAITFDISAGGSFGKFTGAFGITTDEWHQSDTVAVLTESGSLNLTWILPEDVKTKVPADAEVMLGYWWGEVSEAVLQTVTVKYSIGSQTAGTVQQPAQNDTDRETNEGDKDVKKGNAAQIASEIRIGWNLGNTLDCYDVDWKVSSHESAWGNPKTTKEMIDAVKAAGFNAVRIPVSWTDHITDDGTIDGDWMNRVQEVVDYSMDNGLYTILNVHHDDYTWLNPTYSDEAAVKAKLVKIWTQIAARFKDYDTKLLFEGMNEPRVVGSANEWMGGTPEERDVINHLHQAFVDTVRASGGTNAERTLIVTTHAASITADAVNGLVIPNDGNIIVSIHNYAPWKFTTKEHENVTAFDAAGQAELEQHFDFLYDKFVSKGVPVIIGEFGAENKNNAADRAAYYSYYVQAAAKRNIPCFVWDNGPADSFGLLNRKTLTWYDEAIVQGMMDAVK